MQTFTFGNYKYGMFRTTGVNVNVDFVYVSTELYVYRVFSKGRNVVGPSKSLIFRTFSDVLDFF